MNTNEELKKAKARVEQLEQQVQQEKLAELLATDKELHPLAERAHGLFCKWNHTDGCSWGYEQTGEDSAWSGSAHQEWLKKIKTLVANGRTIKEINDFFDVYEDFRKSPNFNQQLNKFFR